MTVLFVPDLTDLEKRTHVELTAAEAAWLDRRSGEPPRNLPRQANTIARRWTVEAGHIATALRHATATVPPQRNSRATGRGCGPSDPTGAVTSAVWATLTDEAGRWAHATAPCQPGGCDRCPTLTSVKLLDQLAATPPDGEPWHVLTGTDPTSRGWVRAVDTLEDWHKDAAVVWRDTWREAWATCEDRMLRGWLRAGQRHVADLGSIAGRLAGWNGKEVRRCRLCSGAAEAQRTVCTVHRHNNAQANR